MNRRTIRKDTIEGECNIGWNSHDSAAGTAGSGIGLHTHNLREPNEDDTINMQDVTSAILILKIFSAPNGLKQQKI